MTLQTERGLTGGKSSVNFYLSITGRISKQKKEKILFSIFMDAQPGGQQFALGNQRFPFRIRSLAMCRGELSAVTVRLIGKCSKWVEVVERNQKCIPLPVKSCETLMSCEKKTKNKTKNRLDVVTSISRYLCQRSYKKCYHEAHSKQYQFKETEIINFFRHWVRPRNDKIKNRQQTSC